MTNYNWVDYIVLGIFFISVMAGLMRGLVKEVISILTWLAAFVVSSLFATRVASSFTGSEQVQSAISSASSSIGINPSQPISVLAIGTSFVGLFVVTLIVGSIINYFVSHAVEGQGISFANRLLGAIFGLGRGFLVNLVMMFLIQLTPFEQQPWWAQSQFVQAFKPTVQWFSNIVQPGIENLKSRVGQTIQDVGGEYLPNAENVYNGMNR